MSSRLQRYGWAVVFVGLAALSIPWFLWRSDAVVAGLPVWIWWHVGWLVLASLVFWAFATTAWGLWIDEGDVAETAAGDDEEVVV